MQKVALGVDARRLGFCLFSGLRSSFLNYFTFDILQQSSCIALETALSDDAGIGYLSNFFKDFEIKKKVTLIVAFEFTRVDTTMLTQSGV